MISESTPNIISGLASNCQQFSPSNSQSAQIQTPRSGNTYLVYPSVSSGALPETFPKIPKKAATDTIK